MFIANEEGQITEFRNLDPKMFPILKESFAQFFGEIESVEVLIVSGLAVGDDVPNWAEYEKIEMPEPIAKKIAVYSAENNAICGILQENSLTLFTNGSNAAEIDKNGTLKDYSGPPAILAVIQQTLQPYNINISSISQETVSWNVGDKVPNWEEYEIYTRW